MVRTIAVFAVSVVFYLALVYVFKCDTSSIDKAAQKAYKGTVAVLKTVGK